MNHGPCPSHPARLPWCPYLVRLALVAALCSTVACTANRPPKSQTQGGVLQLLAVAGDRLLLVTPHSGDYRVLAISPLLEDVSALAFDAQSEMAYAIAHSSSAPRLLRVNPRSGEVEEIGPIELPFIPTRIADAMVFDPESHQLYLAAGSRGSSSYLLTVDPETSIATRVGRIRNTPQREFDGLALVRGVLYAIDHVSGQTFFFKLTPEGPQVTPLGKLPGKITDLAGDSGTGRLFAAVDGRLATLQISGGLSIIAQSIPESDIPALTALTVISSGPTLFTDGFEGGDLSAWSGTAKN